MPERALDTENVLERHAVRVSGKSKDELQRLIGRLREESEGYPVPLQFQNYR